MTTPADQVALAELGSEIESSVMRQRTKGVDSARRALQILLQFSESKPELTVDQLLQTHDISTPSAYRYLALLREMHLIEERTKGVYVLSPQVLKLARAAEVSFDYRAEAQPVLDGLRDVTGESALFLRCVNDAAVCLAIAESEHPVGLSFQPGHLMPLHSGAAAKILLAAYAPSKRSQYLDRLQPPLSPAARLSLEQRLDEIRHDGYAESAAEVDQGIWAAAAAVYANGAVVGSITVAAPSYRVTEELRAKIGTAVRASAAELESAIASRV